MASSITFRAKLLYIIEWVLIACGVLGLIATIIYYLIRFNAIIDEVMAANPDVERHNAEVVLNLFITLIGVFGGIAVLLEVVLNTLLTKGVNSRYHRYCKIWLVIQIVLLVLGAIGCIRAVVQIFKGYESAYWLIGYVISFTYRIVSLKVVTDFMAELINDAKTGRVYETP